jgi:pyridoxamine 5'-phosphate oxidase
MKPNLQDLRVDYGREPLNESTLLPDPIAQFQLWFDEASKSGIPEPNAMSLATADASGQPSCRTVLLKDLDERGFVFFTNYTSRKGQHLAANPRAALLFPWIALQRQVEVVGPVEKLTVEESTAYFDSRPRGSRIGAWVSNQSTEIPSRDYLLARNKENNASPRVRSPSQTSGADSASSRKPSNSGKADTIDSTTASDMQKKTAHGPMCGCHPELLFDS